MKYILYNSKELQDGNGRMYYFDNLKFLLIFLVVLGHFLDPLTKNGSETARVIWLFISLFHMPLFILISGIFAKKSIERNDKSKIIIYLFLSIVLNFLSFAINKFIYKDNVSFNLLKVSGVPWYLFAMAVWYYISMKTKNINKKVLIAFNIIIALIVGYDKNIGDYLMISRAIVFYPFFLLGTIVKKETITDKLSNKTIRIVSIILFIMIFVIAYVYINNIYWIRPLTTARNSYFSLKSLQNYGFLIRLMWYGISTIMSILFMMIVPRGKTLFSELGKRTLAVYFLHTLVLQVWYHYNYDLGVIEYILLSIIVTIILSLKIFDWPFKKILSLNFYESDNKKLREKE